MTINKDTAPVVDTLLWHGIIDATTGILSDERYTLGGLTLQMHQNPSLLQGADLVYVPYAASLWRGNSLILLVAIEEEDYRSLAQALGCSVREILEEKQTRSYFGAPRLVAYGGSDREDLEPFEGKLDYPTAKAILQEWVCDIIETMEEPKKSVEGV